MKRSLTNFLVDGVIGAASLVTAVSGILFLLPRSWVAGSASGTSTMLGIPTASWLSIHDWSGIVLMASVLVHCALHWRWIASMTRRTFGHDAARRRAPARRPATVRAAPAVNSAAASRPQAADAPARYTRAGFLKGAALVCGGLVAGGVVSRAVGAAATDSSSTAVAAASTATSETSAQTSSSSVQTDSSTQSTSGTQTTTTVARVIVDSSACIGCGRCIGVCPQGVFTADGGRATAADPEACVLCRRCVRVCPAGAITLNG
jgi:NAD-dependent dihydropyrimidine dehydrogenase PreA subunit